MSKVPAQSSITIIIIACLSLLQTVLSLPVFLYAETAFDRLVDNSYFSLIIPDDLISTTDDSKQSLLFLRTRNAPYPTFNIIKLEDALPLNSTPKAHSERILSQYKSIGLTSAKVVDYKFFSLPDGRPAYETELIYSMQAPGPASSTNMQWQAEVTLIPLTGDQQLVGTYISPVGQTSAVFPDSSVIIKALSFKQAWHLPEPPTSASTANTTSFILYGVLFLTPILLLLLYVRKKRAD